MISIAVLASGRGSNFDAILRAARQGDLEAHIAAVVSDRKEAPVLEKARAAGIPALVIPPSAPPPARPAPPARERGAPPAKTARAYRGDPYRDEKILELLAAYSPRFLVLAGYMRIVTPKLIEAFRSPRGYSRIVNIHPSLLPAFPGVDSYGQAFRHGTQVAGVTVHLVEEEVDAGPICAQQAFSIQGMKSVEEVEKRGLEIEHRLYPETLKWVLPERFDIEARERRLCVCPH